MKQQVLCCLLLTISAGTSYSHGDHGVKGSFSKSYSSSAASASSSAFSSSFSSGGDQDLNDINNSIKAGSSAVSSAFANPALNGASAKAGSGAYAGSGSYSGSFSGSQGQVGTGYNPSPGSQLGGPSGSYSGSGSFSSSGSLSGSGVHLGSGGNSGSGFAIDKNAGVGLKPNNDAGGSYIGKEKISEKNPFTEVPDLGVDGGITGHNPGFVVVNEKGSLAGSGSHSNSGLIGGHAPGLIPVSVSVSSPHDGAPGNGGPSKIGLSSGNKEGSNLFVNDFRIPEEYSPNRNSQTGPKVDSNNSGSSANTFGDFNSGNNQGSINKSKKPCCQGPFPGPKGSIYDYKPAPADGGSLASGIPEQQKPLPQIPTNPSYVNNGNVATNHHGSVNTGTTGLSPNLINTFPGSPGSIHDSKPVTSSNIPTNPGGNIHVAVNPDFEEKPIPGSGALSVIGKLPGPTGSIHTSVLVGQNVYQHQQKEEPSFVQVPIEPTQNIYNKNPVPSTDIINSFPGKPGNIYDSKPVPTGGIHTGVPAGQHVYQNQQKEQPSLVQVPIQGTQNIYNKNPVPSPDIINSFPGKPGNIYDNKPVPTGGIHTGVPAGQHVYQNQQKEQPSFVEVPIQPTQNIYNKNPVPSPDIINSFPGKPGNIYDSKPVPTGGIHTGVSTGQNVYQHQQKEQPSFVQVPIQPTQNIYNKNPVPSPDIINSFPGKPGNIHDSKPAAVPQCVGSQCQPSQPVFGVQKDNVGSVGVGIFNTVPAEYNPKPIKPLYPDCSTGQCDEFGGRLGCHGNDCFGPGKKPSYVNSGSMAGSHSNSNANHESGTLDIDFSQPVPGTYLDKLCTNGKCNGKPANVNSNCLNGKCNGNIPPGVNIQQPGGGIIAVEVTPQFDPYGNKPDQPNSQIYPIPGSINFDTSQPVPEYPGMLCSGIQCLLAPVPGSKNVPGPLNQGCSGAYCISVIPAPQGCSGNNCGNPPKNKETPNCVGSNCGNVPNNKDKPDLPKNVYQGTNSNSNANADSSQTHHKIDININKDLPNDKIPIDLPIEAEIPISPKDTDKYIPKKPLTPNQKPEDKRPGGSMDFLLPGNKPHHPHHPHNIKPHEPANTNQEFKPDKVPGEGYYSCTGSSCPLPKHPGQISGNPHLPHPTPNYPSSKPDGKFDCGGKPCEKLGLYPGLPNIQQNCGGGPCKAPDSENNRPDSYDEPDCFGGQCKYNKLIPSEVPDVYKGAGGRDRLFVPEYNQKEVSPLIIPVLVSGVPQTGPYGNSAAHAGTDNQKGFVSGSVVVEKPDGKRVPVVDVQIPNVSNHPDIFQTSRHPVNGGVISGSNSGGYSGSSSLNLHGNLQGTGCSGGLCNIPNHGGSYPERTPGSFSGSFGGNGCASGNCGNGGLSGSHSGSSGESIQGNVHGIGCSTGKCGAGSNGGQAGSYSGSASYGGVKGGCKTGACGFPSTHGGAYNSGSFASSSSFSGSNSGSYGGGVKEGINSGSYSSSGSHSGVEDEFPLLKELIHQSINGGDFHSGSGYPGAGSFSRSGSYSGGGGASHSLSYSSSGSL